ncbi:rho GTPase-activating protein 8 isoform 2 [Planoprotostelium fungivorum]|uniref:Rho GTPase-activating protein 8 isoform 2 n=1 Tax=Planoprotostelium fungivorum TaxID=1890364 RepID=A0A2P6NWN5_9EUKA|nr:rho GTPase-activating protein 8 isoform 2 [Planoprotostelium fungivorum]
MAFLFLLLPFRARQIRDAASSRASVVVFSGGALVSFYRSVKDRGSPSLLRRFWDQIKAIEHFSGNATHYKEHRAHSSPSFSPRSVPLTGRTVMEPVEYDHNYEYHNINFGIPLEVMMERPNQRIAPSIVKFLIRYINKNGLKTPQLFRTEIDMKAALALKDRYNRGELAEPSDPHVASFLLRLWLLELPEPLFTFNLYDEFMSIADESSKVIVQKLREILKKLPEHNNQCSQLLIMFLSRTVEMKLHNNINSKDLSWILGTTLFRPPTMAFSVKFLINQPRAALLTQHLIDHFDTIYGLDVAPMTPRTHRTFSTLSPTLSPNGGSNATTPTTSPRPHDNHTPLLKNTKHPAVSIRSTPVFETRWSDGDMQRMRTPAAPTSPQMEIFNETGPHTTPVRKDTRSLPTDLKPGHFWESPPLVPTPTSVEELIKTKAHSSLLLDQITKRVNELRSSNLEDNGFEKTGMTAKKVAAVKWCMDNIESL